MLNRALPTSLLGLIGAVVPATSIAQLDALRTSAVIALEKAALDRFVAGDPQGYLDLYAVDVTYFDPFRERRVDGLAAMQAALEPPKGAEPPSRPVRYELIDPKIQGNDELVVLTFNFVSRDAAGSPGPLSRWNATEIYAVVEQEWKIIHSHWSLTTPLEASP